MDLISLIQTAEIRYPKTPSKKAMSPPFQNFISQLLQRDTTLRLDWPNVSNHEFVKSLETTKKKSRPTTTDSGVDVTFDGENEVITRRKRRPPVLNDKPVILRKYTSFEDVVSVFGTGNDDILENVSNDDVIGGYEFLVTCLLRVTSFDNSKRAALCKYLLEIIDESKDREIMDRLSMEKMWLGFAAIVQGNFTDMIESVSDVLIKIIFGMEGSCENGIEYIDLNGILNLVMETHIHFGVEIMYALSTGVKNEESMETILEMGGGVLMGFECVERICQLKNVNGLIVLLRWICGNRRVCRYCCGEKRIVEEILRMVNQVGYVKFKCRVVAMRILAGFIRGGLRDCGLEEIFVMNWIRKNVSDVEFFTWLPAVMEVAAALSVQEAVLKQVPQYFLKLLDIRVYKYWDQLFYIESSLSSPFDGILQLLSNQVLNHQKVNPQIMLICTNFIQFFIREHIQLSTISQCHLLIISTIVRYNMKPSILSTVLSIFNTLDIEGCITPTRVTPTLPLAIHEPANPIISKAVAAVAELLLQHKQMIQLESLSHLYWKSLVKIVDCLPILAKNMDLKIVLATLVDVILIQERKLAILVSYQIKAMEKQFGSDVFWRHLKNYSGLKDHSRVALCDTLIRETRKLNYN